MINDLAETLVLASGNLPGDGWNFALGENGAWNNIQVPGCWEAQGYDMFVDGPGRYRRSVVIPESWAGQRIELAFEATSYACEIYCNHTLVGSHQGMWTPFAVDVTRAARVGQENLIEVVVYKPGQRYPVRASLAGFLPDVATSFGGLWQPVCLRALRAGFSSLGVETDYETASIRVQAVVERFVPDPGGDLNAVGWQVTVALDGEIVHRQTMAPQTLDRLDTTICLQEMRPWSPQQPDRYTVTVACLAGDETLVCARRQVGFRQLSARGDQLLLNGQPLMVRGILSWGWDPAVIAPWYTPETARAEMRRARAMGFNLIKLCLFVPNQAYFDAADEEGMLLWEELPMWLPEVSEELRVRAPQEYDEITALAAPHPSVVLYSLGCELNQSVDGPLLARLNEAVRARARDVLLCDNSGSGESYGGLDFDLSDFTDYHPYYDLHYFVPLLDAWRRDWQPERPWIFGEFCDSDSFRDQDEIAEARPWWLTERNPVTTWRPEARAAVEWHERMQQANPGFAMQEMVAISHRQSLMIRKYTLEALRRRRGMGGYIITGLRDTPISTSGVWDDLLRPKWAEEAFLQINGAAVLSLDVGRRRRWRYGGDRPDPIDPHAWWEGTTARWDVILHIGEWGQAAPEGGHLEWAIESLDGKQAAGGNSRCMTRLAAGIPARVGVIHWQIPHGSVIPGGAAEFRLVVTFRAGEIHARNEWPVWVYPRLSNPPPQLDVYDPTGLLDDAGDWLSSAPHVRAWDRFDPARLLVVTALNGQLAVGDGGEAEAGLWHYLKQGGRVLLLQQGESPLPVRRCPFWREAIKLLADHPTWRRFPHQGYTGFQFLSIAGDLAFDTPRLLGALPSGAAFRPILRRLDAREFHMSEYLFEVSYGKGRLLGCALRLQGGAGAQPFGWNRNVAGAALLEALVQDLAREETAG